MKAAIMSKTAKSESTRKSIKYSLNKSEMIWKHFMWSNFWNQFECAIWLNLLQIKASPSNSACSYYILSKFLAMRLKSSLNLELLVCVSDSLPPHLDKIEHHLKTTLILIIWCSYIRWRSRTRINSFVKTISRSLKWKDSCIKSSYDNRITNDEL